MSAAAEWLRARLAGAPPTLLERMAAAVPEDGEVPEALAAGAMELYEQVLRGTGGREDALPLLAADALLTHALEARAELDADRLGAFAEAWGGAGRIGVLAGGQAGPGGSGGLKPLQQTVESLPSQASEAGSAPNHRATNPRLERQEGG